MPAVDSIALVATRWPSGWQHSAIVYTDESGTLSMLHLANHCRLLKQPVDPEWFYTYVTVPNRVIDPIRVPSVTAFCDLVASEYQHNRIPYSFKYEGGLFDVDTGQWVFGPTNYGLSCSTFLLALHRSLGIDLIDWQCWEGRADDAEEQNLIVSEAISGTAPAEHVAVLRNEIGERCARVRPQEIVASYAFPPLPLSFAAAQTAGDNILRVLMAWQRNNWNPPETG